MSEELFNLPLFIMQAPEEYSALPSIAVMLGVLAIFYFLMIRPQQKKEKERKKQIAALAKGDRFITSGGIYATVIAVKEDSLTAKIADNVNVEVGKSFVANILEKKGSE